MKILVLNSSPRPASLTAAMLRSAVEGMGEGHVVEWVDVHRLQVRPCESCLRCRATGVCALPPDDGHRLAARLGEADALLIGAPTHWANAPAGLLNLFARVVPAVIGENPHGFPPPRLRGVRAAVVTACNTPWPFNVLAGQSTGALRAVSGILRLGGCRLVGAVTQPNARAVTAPSPAALAAARRLGARLVR